MYTIFLRLRQRSPVFFGLNLLLLFLFFCCLPFPQIVNNKRPRCGILLYSLISIVQFANVMQVSSSLQVLVYYHLQSSRNILVNTYLQVCSTQCKSISFTQPLKTENLFSLVKIQIGTVFIGNYPWSVIQLKCILHINSESLLWELPRLVGVVLIEDMNK